jgi:hypothetical protein
LLLRPLVQRTLALIDHSLRPRRTLLDRARALGDRGDQDRDHAIAELLEPNLVPVTIATESSLNATSETAARRRFEALTG